MLNHTRSERKETLRYIGMEQDTLNDYQREVQNLIPLFFIAY